ncbi:MAG: hypothetical protein NWF01_00120 [Candidatus Bathyarchaeota archaeon]|nr:hypothetical protein [Candidatus Bathyarchaeota archaeon]
MTIFVVLSGLLLVILTFVAAKEVPSDKRKLLLVGGSFIGCYLLIALFMPITSEPITRFYCYSVIPFALLVPFYINKTKEVGVKSKIPKVRLNQLFTFVLLVSMIVFIFIAPIVRNDNDSGVYAPSSSLQGANYVIGKINGPVIWVSLHLHLIEYESCRTNVLLEGYMDYQKNMYGDSFTSLLRRPFFPDENVVMAAFDKTEITTFNAVLFNDYEDAKMVMQGYANYSDARILYEKYILQNLNGVYSSGSIRAYVKGD